MINNNLRIIENTDEIRLYFNDVKKIPILDREREEEIFNLLDSKKVSKEEKDKLKKELVLGNLRYVITIAKQYQNNGLDILDLISEGNIGLLKAIDKFDPKNGNRFISYAIWWIKQNIISSINENGRTIRIPSNLLQETQKSNRGIKYHEVYGDTNTEISYTLPSTIDLSKEIDSEGNHLIDVIRDPNEFNPEDIFNSSEEVKKRVKQLLSILDGREKVIIEKYFGLDGFEVSLEELGEEFNCTKERIRQIKSEGLKKIRNHSYSLLKDLL